MFQTLLFEKFRYNLNKIKGKERIHMWKKVFCLLLTVCLLCAPIVPAQAAEPDSALAAAEALHTLGLFNGIGNYPDGSINYDLTQRPSREQAVTMLIRLLGKEKEALSRDWELPFTDVSVWAQPYVGYAYANGLTAGVSESRFGGSESVTAAQYLTFILRALGYVSGEDFQWDLSWEKTDELGLTHGNYSAANNNHFTRGGIAQLSLAAITATLKGSETRLLDRLLDEQVISARAASNAGLQPDRYRLFARQILDALEGQECYQVPLEDKWLYNDPLEAVVGEFDVYHRYNTNIRSVAGVEDILIELLQAYVSACMDGNYNDHSPWGTSICGFGGDTALLLTDSKGRISGYAYYLEGGPEEVTVIPIDLDSRSFVDAAVVEMKASIAALPRIECQLSQEGENYRLTFSGIPETAVKMICNASLRYTAPYTEKDLQEEIQQKLFLYMGSSNIGVSAEDSFLITDYPWPGQNGYLYYFSFFMDAAGIPVAYAIGEMTV